MAQTGHFYYQDKDTLLWERLCRRFRQTGLSGSAAYLQRLRDPLLCEAEWDALAAEITVGETFFFRYAEQFAALRETILPELLRLNGSARQLRLWSAGCANGAEPYSLAILLRQLLGDALPEWRLALLGTDLNEAALQQARLGIYSRWTLRGQPADLLEHDFHSVDGGRRWQLRSHHRALARFRSHNLLSLLDGSSPLELNDFDLILCRNVLIYFHPDVVRQVVRALAERLRPGGWLLLGHAEPNPAFAEFLQLVELPGTVAYRRPVEGKAPPLPTNPPDAPVPMMPPPPATRLPLPAMRHRPAPEPLPQRPEPGAGAAGFLRQAREAADRDDLAAAAAACNAGLKAAPTDPLLHHLDGLVARAQGQPAAAEAAFRRAIYLRRDFAMAHYQLGLLLLDEGRRLEGRRALANAARIVAAWPGETLVEEGDGMTAQQLRAGIRLQLNAPAGRST
ncbi:protein-glutamate O-methyltransferase CheR [Pseudoroseomonas oryzae]|uniref:Protein-glutamate O-methyltransferase CheR n=2 Tax=Teichococcus oryzae TaxID=1608942 RepID=A0A5B2TDG8_9PROT|nr:protein-glutamate O-methyltransferase CheR [Pseudoroseomonas oryzae]